MKPLFTGKTIEDDVDKLLKLKRKVSYPQVGLKGTLFLTLFSVMLAAILVPTFTLPRKTLVEGETASANIKARRSFEIVDEKATQKLKDIAESAVKSIYDYDPEWYPKTIRKLFIAFERMKKDYYTGPGLTLASHHTFETAKKAFGEALGGISIEDGIFSYLESTKFNWRISWTVNRLSRHLKDHYVISDKGILGSDVDRGIIIKNISENKEFSFDDFDQILDVAEAKRKVLLGTPRIYSVYNREGQEYVGGLAASLIFPNLSFNSSETKRRKEMAIGEIKPIIIKVDKGEIIVRKGEIIQKRHLVILEGIRRQFTEQRPGLFIFFTAIFLFFFFQIISNFALANFSNFKPSRRDVIVLGFLTLIFLIMVKLYLFSAGAIGDRFTWLPASMFLYLIPIAASAMIVRFLIGTEGAIVFSLVVSVALSLLLERNFLFAIYALTSCFVGIHAVSYCRAYSDIYRAGFKISIANVAVVFSIIILSSLGRSATYEEIAIELFFGIGAGFFSGLISSILVVTITPLFEYLFGYTTDVKLLELSNLNNPILRDLMIRAPGSYHHSMMVGTLAENAAEAIGVDMLLARVGGYYHDIGKTKNPHYYIENQFGGFNIHDKQPPHLSKTMIMSHVKAGVRMGIDRKLGGRVVDIISQHHGTTLLLYFYQKAKGETVETRSKIMDNKKESTGGEKNEFHETPVDENEYRYAGPRPQTVEAAIVMMADSVEAATRAMNTSHLPRLKVVCEKIVNRLFTDGQLDECNLTLKDLSRIIDSFYHVLIGVYHRRISYPGGIRAEQPYDANYYPKPTKEDENSRKKDSAMDDDAVLNKMGS